jgi:hypothetical protein
MKSKLFLFGILFILAASVYSQPNTTLHFMGGYSIPMGDMKGDFGSTQATFTANTDSNTYFMHDGFNFGLGIKYSPYKNRGFKILGGISYNGFSQSIEYTDIPDPVKASLALRIFSLSAGLEYSRITRTSKINPFVNAEFTANFFSGNYNETYQIADGITYTLKPSSRYGFQFGGGADFVMGQRLGFMIGAKYNLANLFGKKSTGDIAREYGLNDKEEIINGVKYYNRTINYLQIYAGITLYLGL